MFLNVDGFLNPDEVVAVRDCARSANFIDGRRTNPHNATKNNAIGDPADPSAQRAAQIALGAFQRSEPARNFAIPERIALPQLARYGEGMTYGAHIDAAFMAVGSGSLRSDVSCTIFIGDPSTYVGGELVVTLGTEEVSIRGNPGDAVLYPSTTVHRVTPVTAGERLVMITFIQSRIPDPMQRELIYTLGEIRALEALKMDWRNRVRLDFVIQNLQRFWSR